MDRISEIQERIKKLEGMINNCYRVIELYFCMKHPNREKLIEIYKNNVERLIREKKELELEKQKMMSN
jgi:hypothetical protein